MKHFLFRSLFLCGLLAGSQALAAQDCDLACNGSPEFPLQVAVSQSCTVTFDADVILEAPQTCPGDKILTVRDTVNTFIAEGTNVISFSTDGLINRRFSVTVTDPATGIFCVGFIRLVDNIPPLLTNCEEMTVGCLADTHPDVLGYPAATDNCTATPALEFYDEFTPRDCFTDTAGVISRRWIATDAVGRRDTCYQEINILRAMYENVTFPPNQTLSCDDPDADPDITGRPTLQGQALANGGLCGLNVSFLDDTAYICNNYMYQIERTWTVTETCTDFFSEAVQTILVTDDTDPVLTCPTPEALVFSTDGNQCAADLTLPPAGATDNCGADITFTVQATFGGVGLGPHAQVPVGTHTVQYSATDECGNTSICSVQLTVEDNKRPVASCVEQLIVSVGSQGIGTIEAPTFDEGSHDNCEPTVYYKVKRQDNGACDQINGDDDPDLAGSQEWFDDMVRFCCTDVTANAPIIVALRVYEVDPGAGPVDPEREILDGDLSYRYNDCFTEVTVQDALGPVFTECPDNLTIDCAADQSDLSVYGQPEIVDNCQFAVDSTVTTDLDDCGAGTIQRRWIAVDLEGLMSVCQQTITVTNTAPLTAADITWPDHFTTYECGAATDVEDLPTGHQEPIIDYDGCGIVAVNHEDVVYNTAAPACYKILRTWTVIDWCHFDPQAADGQTGEFTYIQQIRIKDNNQPVLTCPENVMVGVADDCESAYVSVPPVTGVDCSTQLIISNDSPYAESSGADISGIYPLGTTLVTVSASDRCGNTASCTISVTVTDQEAPDIACIVGLSTTLSNLGGQAMAEIAAEAFIASASDNCDPVSDLTYTIRTIHTPGQEMTPPTTSSVVLSCDNAGTQMVEVWATDTQGNSEYCTTIVAVQDNHDFCEPTNSMGMIAGGVLTEEGEEVEHVQVNVLGYGTETAMTGIDGAFMFPDLPLGNDYTVEAANNQGLLNGVTTIDLILISRHVLGTAPLDSPYKIIAADVDRSGHVSTLDIIRLRKLILMVDAELPNNNTSWRFVDANYVFPDPTNPFATYFPEVYSVSNMDEEMIYADFVAIKVGDVNGSVVANSFMQGADDRGEAPGIEILVDDAEVTAGDWVDITFRGEYLNELMGYQFTLEFDPNALEVSEILAGDLPNLYPEENFGLNRMDEGVITTVWHEFDESAIGREAVLFTLHCQAKQSGHLSDWLYLSSRYVPAEAYQQDGTEMNLQLSFQRPEIEALENGFELFQNRPNPWKNETIIPFQLDSGGDARLSIYDVAGKLVYRVENYFPDGYHEIGVSRADLPATGIFYYTLEAGDQRATRKMVLTD